MCVAHVQNDISITYVRYGENMRLLVDNCNQCSWLKIIPTILIYYCSLSAGTFGKNLALRYLRVNIHNLISTTMNNARATSEINE